MRNYKIFALAALLATPISAFAAMSCTELGTLLAGQQHVGATPTAPIASLTSPTIGTRFCDINFIYSSRSGTARNEGGINRRVVFCRPESENASDCCKVWAAITVTSTVVTIAPFNHSRAGPTSRR